MKTIRLYSWNVNGIRAVHKKGFVDWVLKENPDILCLQETKAHPDQLTKELISINGYQSFFSSSKVKKGYSGVAVYSKLNPVDVKYGFDIPRFDDEGRTLILDYKEFFCLTSTFRMAKCRKKD